MADPKYLTPAQVVEEYGLNLGTLANMRYRREGPRFRRCKRKILYSRAELEAWIDRGTVLTTDDRATWAS